MRNELELLVRIERYLTGQLDTDEKAVFEAGVRNNPQWQVELLLQQEIRAGLERLALKEQVLEASVRFHKGGSGMGKWVVGGGAVVVVIIIAVVWWWMAHTHAAAHLFTKQHAVTDTALILPLTLIDSLPADSLSLLAAGAFYNKTSCCTDTGYRNNLYGLPVSDQMPALQWWNADSSLPGQVFVINNRRDTLLETNGGILLTLPAYSFMWANGMRVEGLIEVVVKEALDAATVMVAGLNTSSDDALLESGGMFSIEARQNNTALVVNTTRELLAQVPANEKKRGMQVFSGKRMPDGRINWINPRSLENRLVTEDIHHLNFYPPHYLDTIKVWGYDAQDKLFTDSLYFSQAAFFMDISPEGPKELPDVNKQREEMLANGNKDTMPYTFKSGWGGRELMSGYAEQDGMPFFISYRGKVPDCSLDPARIKVIWNDDFQKTLLATRAFEERLAWIFRTGDSRILDSYVYNMDLEMGVLDSLAAQKLDGHLKQQFLAFAARHDGRVAIDARRLEKLRMKYLSEPDQFRKTVTNVQQRFWWKQDVLEEKARKELNSRSRAIRQRAESNSEAEVGFSMANMYRQLGLTMSNVSGESVNAGSAGGKKGRYRKKHNAVYSAVISNTGWHHIDRYVTESVASRTGLQHTNAIAGKQVITRFTPVSFEIANAAAYQAVYVYLLPDKLSSCLRVKDSAGIFKAMLNGLMNYHLVCLGVANGQVFLYKQKNISAGSYKNITLVPVGNGMLKQELNDMGSLKMALETDDEKDYYFWNIQDQQREVTLNVLKQLRLNMLYFVMPCVTTDTSTPKVSAARLK